MVDFIVSSPFLIPMVVIPVICSRCDRPDDVFRHGKSPSGHQRYRCKSCRHVFQLDYIYQAKKPGVKEQIADMAINCNGQLNLETALGTF